MISEQTGRAQSPPLVQELIDSSLQLRRLLEDGKEGVLNSCLRAAFADRFFPSTPSAVLFSPEWQGGDFPHLGVREKVKGLLASGVIDRRRATFLQLRTSIPILFQYDRLSLYRPPRITSQRRTSTQSPYRALQLLHSSLPRLSTKPLRLHIRRPPRSMEAPSRDRASCASGSKT
jgi:hypothetical protein